MVGLKVGEKVLLVRLFGLLLRLWEARGYAVLLLYLSLDEIIRQTFLSHFLRPFLLDILLLDLFIFMN